jgi:hypothetical protein
MASHHNVKSPVRLFASNARESRENTIKKGEDVSLIEKRLCCRAPGFVITPYSLRCSRVEKEDGTVPVS